MKAKRKTQKKKKPTFKIKRPGALTAKAKAAGMTVNEFARKNLKKKGLTGVQARLYYNVFRKANRKRKKKK